MTGKSRHGLSAHNDPRHTTKQCTHTRTHAHTHTHTSLTAFFPGRMPVYTSLQTDNHANTQPLSFFTVSYALPVAKLTASKHRRQIIVIGI